MKKTIALFLFATLNILYADLIIHKEFNITKSQKAFIDYNDTKYKEGIAVTVGQDKTKLEMPEDFDGLKFMLTFMDEKDLITIDDYNFDGYNDICFVHNVGYGGVNIFADYHFYDPKTHSYKRYLEEISKLEIVGKKLVTTMKSGLIDSRSEYRIKNRKPYKETEADVYYGFPDHITKFNSQGKIISTYYEPAHLTISAKRAYLYSEPDKDKKTKVYLIKGDKVKILEYSILAYSMIKVEYKGKKKSYKGWIEIGDFDEQDEQ